VDVETRARLKLSNPLHFLAVGFGSGLAPKMPGTFGTLAAVPLVAIASLLSPEWFVLVTLLITVIGVKICGQTATDLGVHDHGAIVWDEVAGLFVTFLFIPFTLSTALAGFLLFRLFDIAKPWPISLLDKRVKGGFGIMIDDIVAGAMACAVLHAMLQFDLLKL